MIEVLQQRSIPTTRDQVLRLWEHGINYPFFVPDLGSGIVELLQRAAVHDLLIELQRRADLGSGGAASLLAYLSLRGISLSPEAASIALERCRALASGGDGYAQYVFAWSRKLANDDAGAFQWLMKSATKGLFLPAFIDVGRFMVGGSGVKEPDMRSAIGVFWHSHRLGHRFALVYIARLMATGAAGWTRRPLGILLWLPAFLRAHWYSRTHPLSERVFITLTQPKLPLLKGWPPS